MILFFNNADRSRAYQIEIDDNTTIAELKNLIKLELNQSDINITDLYIYATQYNSEYLHLSSAQDSTKFSEFVKEYMEYPIGKCSKFCFYTDTPKDQQLLAFTKKTISSVNQAVLNSNRAPSSMQQPPALNNDPYSEALDHINRVFSRTQTTASNNTYSQQQNSTTDVTALIQSQRRDGLQLNPNNIQHNPNSLSINDLFNTNEGDDDLYGDNVYTGPKQ